MHKYKINNVTRYSDFITGNTSVCVRNVFDTKNTHCEKNLIIKEYNVKI